jgi:hypothetical protein
VRLLHSLTAAITCCNCLRSAEWATPQVTLTYSASTQQQRSGSRSACVKVARGSFAQFGQYIEALPSGKSYALSVWAKAVSVIDASNPTAAAPKVPVSVGLQLAEEPYTIFAEASASVAVGDSWVQVNLAEAEVPASSSSGVLPMLFLMWVGEQGSSTAAEVCVDDASLVALQPTVTPGDSCVYCGFCAAVVDAGHVLQHVCACGLLDCCFRCIQIAVYVSPAANHIYAACRVITHHCSLNSCVRCRG